MSVNEENGSKSPEHKPYGCYYCGYTSAYKYYLVKHFNTHIREKPYTCSGCGKQCNRKEYLNQHNLVTNGNTAFGCEECGKHFTYKTSCADTKWRDGWLNICRGIYQ